MQRHCKKTKCTLPSSVIAFTIFLFNIYSILFKYYIHKLNYDFQAGGRRTRSGLDRSFSPPSNTLSNWLLSSPTPLMPRLVAQKSLTENFKKKKHGTRSSKKISQSKQPSKQKQKLLTSFLALDSSENAGLGQA